MGLWFPNDDNDEHSSTAIQPLIKYIPQYAKIALIVFISILGIYLTGLVAAIQYCMEQGNIMQALKYPPWKICMTAFTSEGLKVLPLVAAFIAFIGYMLFRMGRTASKVKSVDDRGYHVSNDGAYGTADWMTREEAEGTYEIAPIDKANGIILAQYSEDGKECISLPAKPGENNNIAIFGSPGTGKSYCFVRNAAFQAIKRGESAVITDPKGELYQSTAEIFRSHGYKVKVFNLLEPVRSDAWDCASEIFDPVSGNIDEIRVAEFADILMKNSSEGDEDGFWAPGENNLLKSVIFYRAYLHEQSLISMFRSTANKKLFPNVTLQPEDEMRLHKIFDSNHAADYSLVDREHAFRFLAMKVFNDSDKADDYVRVTKSKAESCTIADIYCELVQNDLNSFETKFAQIPISHPAAIAWGIFKNSSPNTQPGFVTGLAQKLQLFQMRDIRRITANKDIDLASISANKTAVYVIISDKSAAMRPISSLFFNFLFKDISEAADKYGAKNRLPVNVICDEFANLGRMPQFEVVIATVRSRCINLSIILQSTTQLNKVYGEDDANTIIACCDTILFIGCNDMETAKFISDHSGVESIRVYSYKDDQTAFGTRSMMQHIGVSDGGGKRVLMNPDEVMRLPTEEVLLYHRGHNMLKAKRCGYVNHPYFKLHSADDAPEPLDEVYLRDYELASEKYNLTEQLDAFLMGDANNAAVSISSDGTASIGSDLAPKIDTTKAINEDEGASANKRTNRNIKDSVRNSVPNSATVNKTTPGKYSKAKIPDVQKMKNIFED